MQVMYYTIIMEYNWLMILLCIAAVTWAIYYIGPIPLSMPVRLRSSGAPEGTTINYTSKNYSLFVQAGARTKPSIKFNPKVPKLNFDEAHPRAR
ncbi:hypothetical protein B0O99DRAFT_617519 [Bisporella sp. PMI_857]|nr:hypothetical protein B0O99DRAFT_617519 [Bisporella sp. PMI_857]